MTRKILLTALALSAAFIAGMAHLRAHTAVSGFEYEAWCCNGNRHNGDCQEIPSKSVKAVEGGYLITLIPGDHRKVTKPHTYFVKYENARKSGDSEYHLCLFPTEDDARCLYTPPMGM